MDNNRNERGVIFTGNEERTLDDKSRVAIPARLRSQLEKEQDRNEVIYVFYSIVYKRIMIYTVEGWYDYAQPLLDEIEDPDEKMEMKDFLYDHVYEQRLDSQGRIKLESKYFDIMNISKKVKIQGSGRGITIKAPTEEKIGDLSEKQIAFMKRINF